MWAMEPLSSERQVRKLRVSLFRKDIYGMEKLKRLHWNLIVNLEKKSRRRRMGRSRVWEPFHTRRMWKTSGQDRGVGGYTFPLHTAKKRTRNLK